MSDQADSKSYPPLYTVMDTLKSILHALLPLHLRNDTDAFERHLKAKMEKEKLQAERNQWKYGLNYTFETLRLQKEWLSRNQQYVQLKKDEKTMKSHIVNFMETTTQFVNLSEMEKGLREATVQGRVGAYTVMYDLCKLAAEQSRSNITIETLQPNDLTMSMYCSTFTIEIVLENGNGAVKSASLTTVQNDSFKQYPDRDADLCHAVRQFASGNQLILKEKLQRLVCRAELALKYPEEDFENMENSALNSIQTACSSISSSYLSAKRCAGGLEIVMGEFSHSKYCISIFFSELKLKPGFRLTGSYPLTIGRDQFQHLAKLLYGDTDLEKSIQALVRMQTAENVDRPSCCMNVINIDEIGPSFEATYTMSGSEAPGAINVSELVIPANQFDAKCISPVVKILAQAALFSSITSSCLSGKRVVFGQESTETNCYPVGFQLDDSSYPTLKIRTDISGLRICITISVDESCSLDAKLTFEEDPPAGIQMPFTDEEATKLFKESHCIPLVLHCLLKNKFLEVINSGDTAAPIKDSNLEEEFLD